METPASIAKHPIHPMLVALPIGLWVFSLVSDIIYRAGWGPTVWNDVAFYTMAGGIVSALLAAVPGLVDLLSLSGRPKVIGIWHMCFNLIAVAIFAISLWLRTTNPPGAMLPFALSIIGVALLGVSGWLGGELVYRHAVAVETQPGTKADERAGDRAPRRVA
jgi:uncharacterized membrane protein